jgi:ATP-dependent DNA helicase RecG
VTPQVTGQVEILEFCLAPKSAKEIMEFLQLKDRKSFNKNYLKPLLQRSLLQMTIPERPKSQHQKYIVPHSRKK